ncbi:MAG: hypothetical protein JWP97_1662 [Labilithrix sp.]|nr:hypothetical protein [Labilithrix sp.]
MTAVRAVVIGALLVASGASITACSPADPGPPFDAGLDTAPAPAAWKTSLANQDGAVLSVWGSSSRDVWAVGGSLGNGLESLVVRFDGSAWSRLPSAGLETFWWVHGTSATDVWLVGEKGRIAHWNGARLEGRASGTTATLYGVWAAAPDDAWAVGGTPDQPDQPNDVLLHWDGATWSPVALPAPTKTALFKVWGSSKDDVYAVGEAGVIWHRTGGAWAREGAGVAQGRLTTVTGCSKGEIFAVGGRDLLTSDGAGHWTRASLALVNDVNGVACAPPGAPAQDYGRAVIVGGGSLKLRLVGSAWVDDFGTEPYDDLHGAWVDETGAFWGAGGKFNEAASQGVKRNGTVARYGR